MIARSLALLLSLLLAMPPVAAEDSCPRRRNADCATATRAVEAAIAADPWLAIIDQARGMRLAELGTLLGPEAAAELARQDAAWRRSLSRELFFHPDGTLDEPDPRAALRGALEFRLTRLMRIQADPSGIEGRWMGVQGEAVLRRGGRGRYVVSVATADVNNLAWTCEYDGEGRTEMAEWLRTDDGMLDLRWLGPMLRITMTPRGDGAPVPFCGAAGSVAGLYFRIGDAE